MMRHTILKALAMAIAMTITAPVMAETLTYTYDALGRVTGVTRSSGATVGYTYDPAGNRTQVSATGFPVPLTPARLFFTHADASVDSVLSGTISNLGLPPDYPGLSARLAFDFNGDSQKDVVFQRPSDGLTIVNLSNGTQFTSFVGAAGGQSDMPVRGAGDFDGDGKADLIFQQSSGPVLAMMLYDGAGHQSGGFSDGYASWIGTYQAAGDLNNDGRDDVIVQKADGSFVIWLMGAPVVEYGWYKVPQITPVFVINTPGTAWSVVAVADMLGDSAKEIVLRSTSGAYRIWQMTSGSQVATATDVGGPGAGSTFRSAMDANGDGKAELLLQDSASITSAWSLNGGSSLVNIGNIAQPSNSPILLGQKAIVPPTPLTPPRLFFTHADASVDSVLSGTVSNLGLPPAFVGLSARLAFDFNGDSQKDVVFQRPSDGLTIVDFSNGTQFTSYTGAPGGEPGMLVRGAGDFDGDGKADLIFQQSSGPVLAMMLYDGAGSQGGGFSDGGASWIGTYQAAGDLNNDGRDDVIVQKTDGSFVIWLMSAPVVEYGWFKVPQFTAVFVTNTPGTSWSVVAVVDMLGDSAKEIVLRSTSGAYRIWQMTSGSQVATATDVGTPGSGWIFRSAVDANGDGKAELLLQDSASITSAWSLNGGSSLVNIGNIAQPSNSPILLGQKALVP